MIKRVVHIIPGLQRGGAEVQLLELIKATPRILHIVIVLDSKVTTFSKSFSTLENCEVDFVSRASKFEMLVTVRRKLRDHAQDGVIFQGWLYHGSLLTAICSVGFKVKCFWNIRRSTIPTGKTFFVVMLCALWSRIFSVYIFVNSHSGMRNHQKIGFRSRDMLFVPNGFDAQTSRGTEDRSDKCVRIFCIGRYHYDKGQDLFYDALKRLDVSAVPVNFQVVFIGRDVELGLKKSFRDGSNSVDIRFLGEVGDVRSFLSKGDILILPSRTEGFPNVLCEAMLSEMFCVAADVGDVAAILPTGNILVRRENVDDLKAAIINALSLSPESRKIIGEMNRKVVLESYGLNKTTDTYIAAYMRELEIRDSIDRGDRKTHER